MTSRTYLCLEIPGAKLTIRGADRTFFPHVANAYQGSLISSSSIPIEAFSSSISTYSAVQVPEETRLELDLVVKPGLSSPTLSVRGIDSNLDLIATNVVHVDVNFRDRVGVAFVDAAWGSDAITLALDVCPRKIDYDKDYFAITADLKRLSRALVFECLKSTSYAGCYRDDKAPTDAEWLSALDSSIRELEAAFKKVSLSPSRNLTSVTSATRLDRVSKSNRAATRSIIRGKGSGANIELLTGEYAREIIPSGQTSVTFDTPANRWLKSQLYSSRERISSILRSIDTNPDKDITIAHVRMMTLRNRLDAMLSEDFLRNVRHKSGPAKPGLEVVGRRGYSELYTIFARLNRAFSIVEGVELVSSKNLATLYEEWCFLRVASIVSEIIGGSTSVENLIKVSGDALTMRLAKGTASIIRIRENGKGQYDIAYNMTYRTITGDHKPDVIIRIDRGFEPSTVIVLDAKYRVIDKDAYGAPIVPRPPADTINAMHRYRDAIYVENKNGDTVRPVVKAVVLYPSRECAEEHRQTPLWQGVAKVGVGAIPLLPDNDECLKFFISELLHQDIHNMVRPGLPFQPYEDMMRIDNQRFDCQSSNSISTSAAS